MTYGSSGVRPPKRTHTRTISMISGSVGSARGEGSRGDRGHGEQEGAGQGEEIPDAIWEDLVSDREDEDGVAGLVGDSSEDEAAQGAAPESAAPDPGPQQEAEEVPEEVPPPPNIPFPFVPVRRTGTSTSAPI